MLGGLLLLFVLENMLGILRRRGLKTVSDTPSSSCCYCRDQDPGKELAGQQASRCSWLSDACVIVQHQTGQPGTLSQT